MLKVIISLAALFTVSFASIAFSQERDPAALPLNVAAPHKPKPFTVGFRESYYLADKDTLLGEKHFEEVTARIRGQGNSDFVSAGIDIGFSYAVNVRDYLSIYAPEGYFRFVLGDTPRANSPVLTFGRKKDRWSLLDSFWELGTWQPQYRWDYLRPEEQGLIGVFFELPTDAFRLVLFASPLYVPESGAPYRLNNHHLVSDSPWFFEPTNQLTAINHVTDVHYDPQIPPIEEIIRHGSFGGTVELGARSAGTWARASYIYKPRNQLDLPFEGYLAVGTPNYIQVNILPKVPYHHLAALDIGYKTQNFSFWFANLYDSPVTQEYAGLDYQELFQTYFASPGIEYSEALDSGVNLGVVISYLYKNGHDPKEHGDDVDPTGTNPVFGLPYNFTNALRSSFRISVPLKDNLRSTSSVTYTQNFDDQAGWLRLSTDWMFNSKIHALLEGDLIGSLANRNDNHFLSRYRGNDRIIASGSMTF